MKEQDGSAGKTPDDQPEAGAAEPLEAAGPAEGERGPAEPLERLREQRDQARRQRDAARDQRDRAREELSLSAEREDYLGAIVAAAAALCDAALGERDAVGAVVDRLREQREQARKQRDVAREQRDRAREEQLERGGAAEPDALYAAMVDAALRLSDAALRDRDGALEAVERLRDQRDKARAQRDETRGQRDEAREQRDQLRAQFDEFGVPVAAGEETDDADVAVATLEKAYGLLIGALGRFDDGRRLEAGAARGEAEKADHLAGERKRRALEPEVRGKRDAGAELTIAEREILLDRRTPILERRPLERRTPPRDVAFVTVASEQFLPGLLGLLLSLLDVYPDLESDVFVYHDGSLSPFVQRRLRDVYSRLTFVEPDMAWLDLETASGDANQRIGKFGYMKFLALTHEGYRRVVFFDADILIGDDVGALWEPDGDDFRAAFDCGVREYVSRSSQTGRWIVNSGVLSIPAAGLGRASYDEIRRVTSENLRPTDDLLDRFADQKMWNIFLADKDVTYLPLNYNCNIKYVSYYLGGSTVGLSVLHFAGMKPWNSERYLPAGLVTASRGKEIGLPAVWLEAYDRLLFRSRLAAFRRDAVRARRSPVLGAEAGPSCLLLAAPSPGGAPAGLETFWFHWEDLPADLAAPVHHLVLGQPFLYGELNAHRPTFPADCLASLRARAVKPVLWIPYEMKPLVEEEGLSDEFEINHVLFEAPFSRFMDVAGATDCDLDGFLDDARDDALTFGAPIAAALGFRTILVAGLAAEGEGDDPEEIRCALGLVAAALERKGVELRQVSASGL